MPEQAVADGTAAAGFPLALDPPPLPRSRGARGRGRRDLLPHLAVRRPRRRPARGGQLHHRPRRGSAGPRPARRRRRAARLPQRLPPPRLRAADRQRALQEGDPLPLSRLDLRRHRRPAARRARAPRVRRAARQVGPRVDPGPGRGAGRACCSSTSTSTPRRWPRRRPGSPSVSRPTGFPSSPSSRARRAAASESTQPANWKIVVENYLEGYHVPIAHPGLMRMLDYKGYGAELHDGWAWFDAPLRDEPSGNRLERLYQRLVRPMPGLSEAASRSWYYAFVYPNTAIDLYPDQVNVWQIRPGGSRADRGQLVLLSRSRFGPGGPARPAGQHQVQQPRARRGHRPRRRASRPVPARAATRPARSPPRRRRWAGSPTTSAPTSARSERVDDGPGRAGRPSARSRADPRGGLRPDRRGRDRRGRIARVARRAGASTALVHHYFSTREELLEQALLHSFDRVARRALRRPTAPSRRRTRPPPSSSRG